MFQFIIRDFQSLQEVKVTCKGFTLLLGQSSSGKSACVRALYAATHNRFKLGQVRYGADFADIRLRFGENEPTLLVRRNPTGSPLMKFEGQTYSKMSRSLPPQIEDYLNLGNLTVSNDVYSLNFHTQFDKPLLSAFNQKKVMDLLSSSKGLDDLLIVHSALADKRAQNRGAFRTVDSLINANNVKLSEYKKELSSVEPLTSKMESIYDSLQSLDAKSVKFSNLISLCNQLNYIQNRINLVTKRVLLLETLNIKSTVLSKSLVLMEASNSLVEVEKSIKILSTLPDSKRYSVLLDRNSTSSSLLLSLNELKSTLDRSQLLSTFIDLYKTYSKGNSLNSKYTLLLSQLAEFGSLQIEPIEKRLSILTSAKSLSNKKSVLSQKLSLLSVLVSDVERISFMDSRIDELNNIVNNKICPLCGSKLH